GNAGGKVGNRDHGAVLAELRAEGKSRGRLGAGAACLYRTVPQPLRQFCLVEQEVAERRIETVQLDGGLRRRLDLAGETLFFYQSLGKLTGNFAQHVGGVGLGFAGDEAAMADEAMLEPDLIEPGLRRGGAECGELGCNRTALAMKCFMKELIVARQVLDF